MAPVDPGCEEYNRFIISGNMVTLNKMTGTWVRLLGVTPIAEKPTVSIKIGRGKLKNIALGVIGFHAVSDHSIELYGYDCYVVEGNTIIGAGATF